ncbi:TAXI family TRAP transporter solute-binding subunit [Neobacillus niacini]|uniref:TAXI family TRAP transporter solute-binding subunit n=1 Tax=Neobacillus niacini TaxID=86668 RepID=UPI00398358E0
MKRKFKFLSIIMAVLTLLLLAACGNKEEAGTSSSGKEKGGLNDIFLGNVTTGSNTAESYAFAAGIANIVQKEHPNVQLTVQTSGGGTENLSRLAAGEAQLGVLYSPNIDAAKAGEGNGADKINEMKGIFAWDYAAFNLIVKADSGIKTVEDLKGKSIAVGAPGSTGAVYVWPSVLPEFGITEKNSDWKYLTQSAAATALADGSVDAITAGSKGKISAIEELSLSHDLLWLELGGEKRENAIKIGHGMFATEGDPNLYGDKQVNDKPIPTVGMSAVFAVRADVDEEVVYNITKSLFENLETFYESHSSAKEVTIESTLNPELMRLDLHPGAEKYFKEIGAIK